MTQSWTISLALHIVRARLRFDSYPPLISLCAPIGVSASDNGVTF